MKIKFLESNSELLEHNSNLNCEQSEKNSKQDIAEMNFTCANENLLLRKAYRLN